MNYQQGGGGQYPQQGPRKLLKQRVFHKDGPVMTSTPYQNYNTAPPPGFNVSPQLPDEWAHDATPQFQSAQMYNTYSAPAPQQYAQQQQPYAATPFMMPQQAPAFPGIPGGYVDIISNPLVTNAMKQYGNKIMESAGGQMLGQVGGLKYYFAVDTRYVMRKLKLVLCPFLHKEWSVHYEQDHPVQPRYEINAPDLYIPLMAYVTYILLAGLVLGIQNRFSPEKLGIHASTATGCALVELVLQFIFLYITNIQSNLKTWDLLSYSGYKYVGIVLSILVGQLFQWTGYLVCISYCGLSLAYFMMKSLRSRVMEEPVSANVTQADMYGTHPVSAPSSGTKRRIYFLAFVALSQPLLMLYVSYHLISSLPTDPTLKAAPL